MTEASSRNQRHENHETQDVENSERVRRIPNFANLRLFVSTFWTYVRPYRWALVIAYLGTGIVALTTIAVGFVLNDQLDKVLNNIELPKAIVDFASLIIIILVIRTLIWSVSTYTISWAGANYVRNIRIDIFGRVMQYGDAIIDEESSGKLQTRVIADTSQLGTFIGGTIPTVLSTLVGLLGGIGGAIYVSPKLTILAVGVTALFTIPILAFSPILRRFGERLQKAEAQSGRHAGESFRSRDIVYAFNQLDREMEQFGYFTGEVRRFFLSQERLQLVIFGIFRIVVFSSLVMGASYGLSLITTGELTIGTMVSLAYFAGMIVANGMSVAQLITTFNVAMGRAHKLIDILGLPQETASMGDTTIGEDCEIELRGICYTYPTRDTQALNNINLRIPNQSKVAIVGYSGSGKSMLFKILLKTIEPSQGEHLLNGTPSSEYQNQVWRSCFGFVPQADLLISGTVAENIAYGKPSVPMAEIQSAARLAYAHEFIEELPQGYATDLGEVGARLSGGQRQRLSLARAILIKPSV